MNRKILILLIIIAAALYSYVAFLLAGGSFSKPAKIEDTKKSENLSFDKLVLNTIPVHFENKNRDPFIPYKEKPVKITGFVAQPIAKAFPKKEPPKPPSITITGIMWNPSNPVAMINMPNGGSAVAKPGLVIGDITFKRIEQNRIQVVCEGKEFWINR